MSKLIAMIALIIFTLTSVAVLIADDVEGEWDLASDSTVDGVTGPENYKTYTLNLSKRGNKFVGRYGGSVAGNRHPNSIFTGETSQVGETKVINFQENDMDYHVSYIGKEVAPHTYEGTWYSSNAQSGSFKLQPKSQK